MNRFMEEKWSIYEGSHGMRDEFLDTLSDGDLAFNPGGSNITLGALIRQMGEVEYAYIQSIKTHTQAWSYHNTDAGLDTSVARLKTWLQTLDAEFKQAVAALSDEHSKANITREGGYELPVEMQLDIYLQALLIFFGKSTIYVRAMNKPLTKAMQDWVW